MVEWEKITRRGKTYYVQRKNGRFYKWRKTKPRKKPKPIVIPRIPKREKKPLGFYYDVRLRVFYLSKKRNKSRAGAIAIKIKSKERLSESQIYGIAVRETQARVDDWITYVQPNKYRFLHLHEYVLLKVDFREDYIVDELSWEDLRGW